MLLHKTLVKTKRYYHINNTIKHRSKQKDITILIIM